MLNRIASVSFVLVLAVGLTIVWRQHSRVRKLETERIRYLADEAYSELFSVPPQYFAYDMQLEQEVSKGFLPLYQSVLSKSDSHWLTERGRFAVDHDYAWSHIRGNLCATWMYNLEHKLMAPGVVSYLTTHRSTTYQRMIDRLRLILRLPNPQTALWAAGVLDSLDALPMIIGNCLNCMWMTHSMAMRPLSFFPEGVRMTNRRQARLPVSVAGTNTYGRLNGLGLGILKYENGNVYYKTPGS
jgi:hypothetical protein